MLPKSPWHLSENPLRRGGFYEKKGIDIYFNYVGKVDIAYTEQELEEARAQEEQAEKERLARQRAREKAYREKRKAAKIAANGGVSVPPKVCPHCGKEFTPASNRQIFCSDECCYQARQDKKKAEREAERGEHYYRQRKCAVCGKLFWPTHSQQTLCSDKCRKEKHNQVTLKAYHDKKAYARPAFRCLRIISSARFTNSNFVVMLYPVWAKAVS